MHLDSDEKSSYLIYKTFPLKSTKWCHNIKKPFADLPTKLLMPHEFLLRPWMEVLFPFAAI